MTKRRLLTLLLVAIALLVTGAVVGSISGCGGTTLEVEAPAGVEVEDARIKDDGTLNCDFRSDKSGTLNFRLPYDATMTPENNPAIISGEVSIHETITFSKQVEAGEAYSISPQLPVSGGDIAWGPLVLEFE
jgi:hypothetical protein